MRLSKVVVLALSLCVALSALAFANGSQEGSSAKSQPKTINLNLWRAGTDALEQGYWEGAIKIYERMHPNVDIHLTSIPWGNGFEAKLNTAYVGHEFPDVVSYSIASIAGHAAAGQYAPLNKYVKTWAGRTDIIPKILDLGKYNGKIYGIGFIPDPRVLVWRKDFFAQAGLNPNNPPTTWSQLASDAGKLTVRQNGITTRSGFYIRQTVDNGNAAQDWQVFALQNGSPIINVPENKALFDNPKGVQAAAFLTSMYRAGDSTQVAGNSSIDPFSMGTAAISYEDPNAVKALISQDPSLKGQVGFAPPTKKVRRATFAGLRLLFMGSQSKHKQAAWDFMKFILSKKETWRRYQVMKVTPVLNSLKQRYIQVDPQENAAVFTGVEVGQGYPIVTYSFNFMELISSALDEAYYGKESPQAAFNNANAQFKKDLPAWLNK